MRVCIDLTSEQGMKGCLRAHPNCVQKPHCLCDLSPLITISRANQARCTNRSLWRGTERLLQHLQEFPDRTIHFHQYDAGPCAGRAGATAHRVPAFPVNRKECKASSRWKLKWPDIPKCAVTKKHRIAIRYTSGIQQPIRPSRVFWILACTGKGVFVPPAFEASDSKLTSRAEHDRDHHVVLLQSVAAVGWGSKLDPDNLAGRGTSSRPNSRRSRVRIEHRAWTILHWIVL